MALAGVTGGELTIKGCVADDLRMIRLAFQRLGLRSEMTDGDCFVPGGQELRVERDAGDYQSKIEDGPWPAFPADLTSIAVALATQADGSVLIFEKMFENRLFFVDKLITMGAEITICDPHRAIVIGPRRLRGQRLSSPDIRAGMAMLIAALCAEGASEIHNVRADRPRLRADRRAPARARREHRARRGVIHPIPSGTRDVLPDELRELRAITEGIRGVLRRPRLRRGRHAGARVRGGAGARRRRGRRPGVQALRRARRRAGAALGHDDPDRARGRPRATRPPSRRCASATSRTPTAACSPQRGQPREMLQAGIELVGAPGPEGTAEALTVLCEALDAAGLENWRIGLGDASLYPRLLDRLGVPDGARPQILHELVTRDYVGLAREVERVRRARAARAAAAPRRPRGARRARDGAAGRAARAAARGGGRADDLRPRPHAPARLLHGRGVRGLRRRARARRSAAAGATTTCWGASGASCPPAAGRSTSSGCTRRGWGRAGEPR